MWGVRWVIKTKLAVPSDGLRGQARAESCLERMFRRDLRERQRQPITLVPGGKAPGGW